MLFKMTSPSRDACAAMIGRQLESGVSVPSDWRISRSHIRASSSMELLKTCVPYSSSATSSGYWEDYDSVGNGANENANNARPISEKLPHLNRSYCSMNTTGWSPVEETGSQVPATKAGRRRTKMSYRNIFGSFDLERSDEEEEEEYDKDRTKSPGSVKKRVPGPTIQMQQSTELLRSESQHQLDASFKFCLTQISFSQLYFNLKYNETLNVCYVQTFPLIT